MKPTTLNHCVALLFATAVFNVSHLRAGQDNTFTAHLVCADTSLSKSELSPAQDSSNEDMVYKRIMALPEMKNYFKLVDSIYQNERHAIVLIKSIPSGKDQFYWVQVGIDDSDRMIPEYNFYVYVKNMEVKYYDTMHDKILTLKQWRAETGKFVSSHSKVEPK